MDSTFWAYLALAALGAVTVVVIFRRELRRNVRRLAAGNAMIEAGRAAGFSPVENSAAWLRAQMPMAMHLELPLPDAPAGQRGTVVPSIDFVLHREDPSGDALLLGHGYLITRDPGEGAGDEAGALLAPIVDATGRPSGGPLRTVAAFRTRSRLFVPPLSDKSKALFADMGWRVEPNGAWLVIWRPADRGFVPPDRLADFLAAAARVHESVGASRLDA